ncbi:MAG: DUF937 domain-containing protein [Phyllobacteriaceae bacterium]|nr:DUF937 domain-containing protein [Phyllobacteriaceae bacterium]
MTNLFDMLNAAGNGAAVEAMMRQYGLNQQQMQGAMEALLPAFSEGLKRNAADPYGLGAMMQMFMSGAYNQFLQNPAAAFTPQGMAAGNAILGQLFGSKDLSRAVAAHASTATGLGQEVLKQMLPVLATMIMGGLANQTASRAMSGGFGATGNVFGEIIEQMMKQGMGQQRAPEPEPQAAPMDNPLGKILEGMFGGGARPQQQAPQPSPMDNPLGKILEGMFGGGSARPQSGGSPMGDNPLGRIFEEMMKGGLGGGAEPRQGQAEDAAADNPLGRVFEDVMKGGRAPSGTRSPKPRRPGPRNAPAEQQMPSGRQRNPYDDVFGEMFETGRKTRDDYQKGMESVFDQFLKGMDRGG